MEKVKNRIISEKKKGILGINIGPNKNTKDQKNDFCLGLKNFFDIADYITINISSPNTKDLRNFHDKEKLEDLLLALNKTKKESMYFLIMLPWPRNIKRTKSSKARSFKINLHYCLKI